MFTHEVRKISGKHRHQGGLVIYVIIGVLYAFIFAVAVSNLPSTTTTFSGY